MVWNRVYGLYEDESEVFQAPYAGRVGALFDGEHAVDETMAALPAIPADLLQPAYAQLLRDPTGPLARAARANDDACVGWQPTAPIRMYAAHGDPEAVYANSERCKELLGRADLTLPTSATSTTSRRSSCSSHAWRTGSPL